MASIPDTELDRLKHDISLVYLVEISGIELKKHGKGYLNPCPFNADNEPSLVISAGRVPISVAHCAIRGFKSGAR